MTRLNPSRIAIGALILLLIAYFLTVTPTSAYPLLQSLLAALSSLPLLWLVVAVIAFALLTSITQLELIANIALGAALFLIAYQSKEFQHLYATGQIIFVLFFLIIVTVLMNRTAKYDVF